MALETTSPIFSSFGLSNCYNRISGTDRSSDSSSRIISYKNNKKSTSKNSGKGTSRNLEPFFK